MNIISVIEKLTIGEAFLILLIGMLIILAVLSILVGLLYVIKYAVRAIEKERPSKKAVPAPTETPKLEEASVAPVEEDEETVAAITAAITCILASENAGVDNPPPFRIKKIKQIR